MSSKVHPDVSCHLHAISWRELSELEDKTLNKRPIQNKIDDMFIVKAVKGEENLFSIGKNDLNEAQKISDLLTEDPNRTYEWVEIFDDVTGELVSRRAV